MANYPPIQNSLPWRIYEYHLLTRIILKDSRLPLYILTLPIPGGVFLSTPSPTKSFFKSSVKIKGWTKGGLDKKLIKKGFLELTGNPWYWLVGMRRFELPTP